MKARISIAICLAALAGSSFAADKKVEDLLAHMREAYKAIKSASYHTSANINTGQGEVTLECSFDFKSPGMVRAILVSPSAKAGARTVISDGHTITVTPTDPQQGQSDYTPEALDREVFLNLESICFWDWSQELSTDKGKNMETSTFNLIPDESWDSKHWIVLEETAKKDNVLCRYFIDPKTFLVWRTVVDALDTKKEQQDCKLTSLTLNPTLRDSIFSGT